MKTTAAHLKHTTTMAERRYVNITRPLESVQRITLMEKAAEMERNVSTCTSFQTRLINIWVTGLQVKERIKQIKKWYRNHQSDLRNSGTAADYDVLWMGHYRHNRQGGGEQRADKPYSCGGQGKFDLFMFL